MNGKEKCDFMRRMRRIAAEKLGLEYSPDPCDNSGNCRGRCEITSAETEALQQQLNDSGRADINFEDAVHNEIDNLENPGCEIPEPQRVHPYDPFGRRILDEVAPEDSATARYLQELEDEFEEANIAEPLNSYALPPKKAQEPENEEAKPLRREVLLTECEIAGWYYHSDDDICNELTEGMELRLVRQTDNPHDRFAVAVVPAEDYPEILEDFDFDEILGFVPRSENHLIAQLMDLGWQDIFKVRLTGIREDGPRAGRLRMSVYMQSRSDQQPEEGERLCAFLTDNYQFKELGEMLSDHGFAYLLQKGNDDDCYEPAEKDHIIMLHRNGARSEVYLMSVMATSHKAHAILSVEIEALEEECGQPFILTNIKGPVSIPSEKLSFLDHEGLTLSQPAALLSPYATACLLKLLK